MIKQGDILTLRITDMSDKGQGIGHADGLAVFAAGTVPGDVAAVEITRVKKRYVIGRAVRIEEAGKDRIEPACPYVAICGGCDYQALAPSAQRALKERQLRDKFIRLGGIADPNVREIIHDSASHKGTRNKAVYHISTGGNRKRKGGIIEPLGPLCVGFMARGSHRVFDCTSCMLQLPSAQAAAEALRCFMEEDHVTAYDPRWNQGLMETMTVRTSETTGECMVTFRIHGKGIPGAEKLVGMLAEAIDAAGYALVSVYLDDGRTMRCLAGERVMHDRLGDLVFEIGPGSFYQVGSLTKRMYEQVKGYAGLSGEETLLDLYCGTGTIGLFCAADAGFVLGIEADHQAVLDANRNAVINGITAARYLQGRAEAVLPALLAAGGERAGIEDAAAKGTGAAGGAFDAQLTSAAASADVVILDPPRAGCRPALLDAVAAISPQRIVYMSCDPATLARDIRLLGEKGYILKEATPFENFPWTRHVETVCLLSNRKPDTKVRIDVDLEDYYRIKDSKKNQN